MSFTLPDRITSCLSARPRRLRPHPRDHQITRKVALGRLVLTNREHVIAREPSRRKSSRGKED
jgi:hypothetical protein